MQRHEIRPDPLRFPAAQVVFLLLPHRDAMPPLDRLLLIQVAGETALQVGIELLVEDRLEQARLNRSSVLAAERVIIRAYWDVVFFGHHVVGGIGLQIELDLLARELAFENSPRLVFDFVLDMFDQPLHEAGAIVEQIQL